MKRFSPLTSDAALPSALREPLNSSDGVAFEPALDVMVRQREQHLFRALGQLARDLHNAVRRLGGELCQGALPERVSDVHLHLDDALDMSSQAAHCSVDFAECMLPQTSACADSAAGVMKDARFNHAAAVLAQFWQDLTGRQISKVSLFIGTVQSAMLELVRLTGALAGTATPARAQKVSSQHDADRLLSEFGF